MVYFVGAGPGAKDLITVRGQKLLQEADVIIYAGSLVNPELLEWKKEDCQVYNSAMMTLEEVVEVIVEAEQKNRMTVRLHTGDPCLYGAIREQIDALQQNEIPYEICPGVSAFLGAAASMKLEYTLPEVSQTVIISRTAGRTAVPEKESIASLAEHRATMVLFLSTGHTEKLQKELLEGGYPKETSVAVCYKATWREERQIFCTLGTLAESVKKADIHNTALIIVGDVVGVQKNIENAERNGQGYGRSKLYDPSFTTGYRKGIEKAENSENTCENPMKRG